MGHTKILKIVSIKNTEPKYKFFTREAEDCSGNTSSGNDCSGNGSGSRSDICLAPVAELCRFSVIFLLHLTQ